LGAPTCRTDVDDTLADFSNWGLAVDIAAPGVCILSTYPLEKGEYGTISGTSMASPHVAGALALLASRNNPTGATDVYALYNTLKGAGNDDWVDDSGDSSKEPLLGVSNMTTFDPVLVAGGGGTPANNPPVASFTFGCVGLTCAFTDNSSDVDGSIASWSWDFGDDLASSTEQNPSHAYASDGNYTVRLTVTDNDGATADITHTVSVSTVPPPSEITLAVSVRKSKNVRYADLVWSPINLAGNVDIFGTLLGQVTTLNDGEYTDGPFPKGVTTATYKVCEAGTNTCSNLVTVSW
jgi:PKD repeat protein